LAIYGIFKPQFFIIVEVTPVLDSHVIYAGHVAIPYAGKDLAACRERAKYVLTPQEQLDILLSGSSSSNSTELEQGDREMIQFIHALYAILRQLDADKQHLLLNHVIITGGSISGILQEASPASSNSCSGSSKEAALSLSDIFERFRVAFRRITGISEYASDLQPRFAHVQCRSIPDYFKSTLNRTKELEDSRLTVPLNNQNNRENSVQLDNDSTCRMLPDTLREQSPEDSKLHSMDTFLDTMFFGACLAARLLLADTRCFISRQDYTQYGPKIAWSKLLMN
jgi:hypothetical protein